MVGTACVNNTSIKGDIFASLKTQAMTPVSDITSFWLTDKIFSNVLA